MAEAHARRGGEVAGPLRFTNRSDEPASAPQTWCPHLPRSPLQPSRRADRRSRVQWRARFPCRVCHWPHSCLGETDRRRTEDQPPESRHPDLRSSVAEPGIAISITLAGWCSRVQHGRLQRSTTLIPTIESTSRQHIWPDVGRSSVSSTNSQWQAPPPLTSRILTIRRPVGGVTARHRCVRHPILIRHIVAYGRGYCGQRHTVILPHVSTGAIRVTISCTSDCKPSSSGASYSVASEVANRHNGVVQSQTRCGVRRTA